MKLAGPSPNLDLLRSVAVLLVVLDHLAATFGIAQRYPAFFAAGRFGVLLFFIHTSCVLMMSLERLALSGWCLFGAFYIRRIFRIYPLSTVVIALVLLARIPISSWTTAFHMPTIPAIAFNFLLCGNITVTKPVLGPLWSLPYEVEMYLALPAIYLLLRRHYSLRRLVFVWGGAAILGMVQLWGSRVGKFGIGRLDVAEFAPCFITGVVAYFLTLKGSRYSLPRWLWPVVIVLVSLVYSVSASLPIWSMYGERALGWLACAIVGLCMIYCAEQSNRVVEAGAHCIAKYSYGLYLGQVPVMWFAFVRLNRFPLTVQWIVFAILIFIVPVISYHLIEAPMTKSGVSLTRFLTSPAGRQSTIDRAEERSPDNVGGMAAASRLAS